MRKSNYTYEIDEDILLIKDVGPHDQFVTVTNNAEQVLEEIAEELEGNIPPIVIYRDSEGDWDGMELDKDGRLQFYPLRTNTEFDAKVHAKLRWSSQNHANGTKR